MYFRRTVVEHVTKTVTVLYSTAGEIALIRRIPMIPTDLPFQFKRFQFPIKVPFTITINKAWGQMFQYVGIDLRSDRFSRGQVTCGIIKDR
jgi:ATP-dependent DNA helicase PIF1